MSRIRPQLGRTTPASQLGVVRDWHRTTDRTGELGDTAEFPAVPGDAAGTSEQLPPHSRRPGWRVVVGAALVVAALGGTAYAATRGTSSAPRSGTPAGSTSSRAVAAPVGGSSASTGQSSRTPPAQPAAPARPPSRNPGAKPPAARAPTGKLPGAKPPGGALPGAPTPPDRPQPPSPRAAANGP